MPEIEECRYCADCCTGCIFLEYDESIKSFSCLIYDNKDRVPIYYSDSKYFLGDIESLIGNSNLIGCFRRGVCYFHRCSELVSHKELRFDVRDKTYYRYYQIGYEKKEDIKYFNTRMLAITKIRETRKLIPNFNTLVEILNA